MLLPLHCAQAEHSFGAAVEAAIVTGGCTSSRASLAGACQGAIGTDVGVPSDWVAATAQGAHIQSLATQLVKLREAACSASML